MYATAAETPEAADSDGDLQSCCNTGQARVTFQSLQLPPRGSRRQRLPSATTNPGLTMLSTAWTSRWHGNSISAIVKHRAQFRGETGAEIEKFWSWEQALQGFWYHEGVQEHGRVCQRSSSSHRRAGRRMREQVMFKAPRDPGSSGHASGQDRRSSCSGLR